MGANVLALVDGCGTSTHIEQTQPENATLKPLPLEPASPLTS